jgi:hypothetical protein
MFQRRTIRNNSLMPFTAVDGPHIGFYSHPTSTFAVPPEENHSFPVRYIQLVPPDFCEGDLDEQVDLLGFMNLCYDGVFLKRDKLPRLLWLIQFSLAGISNFNETWFRDYIHPESAGRFVFVKLTRPSRLVLVVPLKYRYQVRYLLRRVPQPCSLSLSGLPLVELNGRIWVTNFEIRRTRTYNQRRCHRIVDLIRHLPSYYILPTQFQ